MKKTIKLSERTIGHMRESNNQCPTKYVIEDIAKALNMQCDWFSTSLKDLGVKMAYLDNLKGEIELHF